MSDKKIESLAFRLKDYESLRALFAELNFEFADKPVNKEHWNQDQIDMVQEAKIIATKDDYRIYYIQTNTDSLNQWKGIATKIIKENNGLCLICSHNPSGFKWIFSSLSKDFSQSFTETRHVPIDIRPDIGVPQTFVEFLEKIKIDKDSTASSIASQISGAFDSFAIAIHDELTVNVFEALKSLSEGIILDESNGLTLDEETLEEIREPIFILLYRIIFILYAEDRGIFPVEHKIYHEKFSFKWLKHEWLLKSDNQKKLSEYQIHERLWNFFRLIELGSEDFGYDSNEFFMRSYYGRIFDRNINKKLDKWKIKNRHLLDAISLLTRTRDKNSNYFFLDYSALETRHLGSIYEHLLEYHLTVKGKKIADLPDQQERKFSGSYYTPLYIVDYIVKNTIEPLIDNITKDTNDKFERIEKILSLNILDPAMGSGHFLIGVVNYIAKRICEIEFEEVTEQHLIERKRDVVRRCVYGVDINPLATDLAMVSLWLETLSSEKPLSFLSAHLKCGNSLIGSQINILFDKQTTLMESQKGREQFKRTIKEFLMFENLEDSSASAVKTKIEKYQNIQSKGTIYYNIKSLLDCKVAESFGIKIPIIADFKAKVGENSLDFFTDDSWQKIQQLALQHRFFHWDLEFPDLFYDENGEFKKNGGFDAIIGNPPYVRQELISPIKPYLKSKYNTYNGTADLFVYFFEKGLQLVKDRRFIGFITSNKWLKTNYGLNLRKLLCEYHIKKFIDFGDTQIFKGATTYPLILILNNLKEKNPKITAVSIDTVNFDSLEVFEEKNKIYFDGNKLTSDGWNVVTSEVINILEKVKKNSISFDEYVEGEVYLGIKTGLNKAFIIDEETKKTLISEDAKSEEIIRPFLGTADVERYGVKKIKKFIILTKKDIKIQQYPAILKHLTKFKKELEIRSDIQVSGKWFELRTCSYYDEFDKPKIIFGYTVIGPRFTIDQERYIASNSHFIIPKNDKKLLGILNSSLGWFLMKNCCTRLQNGYSLLWDYLKKIPISIKDSPEIEKHVEKIMALKLKLSNIENETDKIDLKKKIEYEDKQLDQAVYSLYGINSSEQKIIENFD